jgi:DNA-binding NtrC family response regulator
MTIPWEVVVACSDVENRQRVAGMLAQLGVDAVCIATVGECREVLHGRTVGLVFCDLQLADGDYLDVLAAVACSAKTVPKVVVMAALMKFRQYSQAKARGVLDIIPTPCRPTDIEWTVFLARCSTMPVDRRLDRIPPTHPAT